MSENEVQRAQQLISALNKATNPDTSQFKKDMAELLEEPEIKKIPLPVFEDIFLPMIQGKVESLNEVNNWGHWAGLVGATSPADVCDANGSILFTVPPMIDTSVINQDRDSKITNVMMNYAETASVNPVRAKGELVNGLVSEISNTLKKPEGQKYSWDGMFRYYGLINEETKPQTSDQSFDFDE